MWLLFDECCLCDVLLILFRYLSAARSFNAIIYLYSKTGLKKHN